jgi:hypothetical protein
MCEQQVVTYALCFHDFISINYCNKNDSKYPTCDGSGHGAHVPMIQSSQPGYCGHCQREREKKGKEEKKDSEGGWDKDDGGVGW